MKKLKNVKVSEEGYGIIKSGAHHVPRNSKGDVVSGFVVGRHYMAQYKNEKSIEVRCTQNCPVALKAVASLDYAKSQQ